jgi:DNA-binding MarR family transcriptional regulator
MKTEPKEEELARRFLDFAINLKRLFRSTAVQTDRSLSEERYRSLLCLLKMEEAGLSELSERLSISASSLCIMLGKLEEEGLVERHRSKEDRRHVRYSCTPKGRYRVIAAQKELLDQLAGRFKQASAENRERLLKALDEIESVLGTLGPAPFKE